MSKKRDSAKKKKRSFEEVADAAIVPLSEQINAQFAPQAEADPEAGFFMDEPFARPRGPMIDPALEQDQGPAKQQKLRIVADIAVDPKLAGRKSSRKEALSSFGPSESSGDDDDQIDDDYDDDDDDNIDEDDAIRIGDMSVSSSDEDDEDDAPALKFIDAGDGDDNDLEEEEEEEDVMAAFRANQELELKKAKHTMTQTKVWNRLLALRIKMQGEVSISNSLPLPEDAAKSSVKGDDWQGELKEQLKEMAELRSLLLKNHPDFSSVSVGGDLPSKSASSNEWWAYLESASKASVAAEEGIVNQWSRQTNVQSGRVLKALGRSVVEQVRTSLLQDREKLIRRTQLNREDKIPLGRTERRDYEENIFDDSEFYGHLLKAFLQATGAAAPGHVERFSRDKKKKKKSVAKNKMDMQIQDKLMNFMAPLASNVLPPMADALFASLFGASPSVQAQ